MDIVIFTCVSGIYFQRSIGAYQVAHFMRQQGYTVQVIDFTDHFKEEELHLAIDKFVTEETLAVGLSTTFWYKDSSRNSNFLHNEGDDNKFGFKEIPTNISLAIDRIKNKSQQIKIVVGGAKSEFGKTINGVDAVIHGYAEDKFLEYINSLPNNKKRTRPKSFSLSKHSQEDIVVIKDDPIDKKFSIENLDHRFTEQDFILKGETLPLEVSRGCIFKCAFCAFPLNGKSKLDYIRDPEEIKDELIYNYENFGTTNYFLSDDTFNDSTEKVSKIHRAITSLPFKIKFTTYLRLDLLYAHKEQIDLLYEMGLASPFFGIESFNQKSASSIGKGMNSNRAKDFLLELYYDRWKEEIPLSCSFIVGLPYETRETMQQTYDWVKNNPVNSIFFPLALTEKNFYKSEFNVNYAKYGYRLDEQGNWSNDYFTVKEATELAEQYNNELMRKENYASSWFLMTLLNHGYSLDEILTTKVKDLNYTRILKARQKNIREYKQRLLNTV